MLAIIFEVYRQSGIELIIIFKVIGVLAQDIISLYSSIMLVIGLFLINFVY